MKRKLIFYPVLMFCGMLAFSSCSDDDLVGVDEKLTEGCDDFNDAYYVVADAFAAYNDDPSIDNCESYRAALTDFYNEYSDCYYWSGAHQDAYDEIQGMDCSEDMELDADW